MDKYMQVTWHNQGYVEATFEVDVPESFQEGLDYILKLVHSGVDFKVQFLPFIP